MLPAPGICVKQMSDDPATEKTVPPKTVMSPRWPGCAVL